MGRASGQSQIQAIITIQIEHADGGATHGGASFDAGAVPAEMFVPVVFSRVKQRSDLVGIGVNAGEVGSFVQIAVDAGQTEILQGISAAMLDGADVLDVQRRQRGVILMKLAILATVLRPLSH